MQTTRAGEQGAQHGTGRADEAGSRHAHHTVPGRRERKKDAVRRALRVAALRLVSERGLAAVTVEDITDVADVSKRTFFNYFSCKEDALVGPGRELGERIAGELACRPPGEPWLQALRAVFDHLVAEVERTPERRADWAARMQLVQIYPGELLPRQLAAFADLERAVVAGIALRADADADLYPALVGAVAVAVARVAFTWWCQSDSASSLVAALDRAFDLLAAGLVDPAVPEPTPASGPALAATARIATTVPL
jgi:AcrR family transcriptional regulator